MTHEYYEKLLAPFNDADIEWRLQWTNEEKTGGRAVPYVTNRAIQHRLDSVVGIQNWKNEYVPWHTDGKKASQICGISIYFAERCEWITKYDGAEDSDIEPVKGGLSDSMKRAAVQWGIGRYLYSMNTVWVKTEQRGKSAAIADSEYTKLNNAHQAIVARIFGKQEQKLTAQCTSTPQEKAPATQQPTPQEKQEFPKTVQTNDEPYAKKPEKAGSVHVWVDKVKLIPSVSGTNNANLQIRDANGNTTEVFLQEHSPAIEPGVVLKNPKFSRKENQGVTFLILDDYEIEQQAA